MHFWSAFISAVTNKNQPRKKKNAITDKKLLQDKMCIIKTQLDIDIRINQLFYLNLKYFHLKACIWPVPGLSKFWSQKFSTWKTFLFISWTKLETNWSPLTDERLPALRVFTLSPGVWPAHYHRVWAHATQAAWLDHVTDAFTWLLGHDALHKAFHTLFLHQVLQCLRER